MRTWLHRVSLAGLLLLSPARLFERIAHDPWYRDGLFDWLNGLRLPSGTQVLELGCGPGALALELARRDLQVSALDRSAAMVDRVRDLAALHDLPISIHQGDACASGLAPDSFDAVIGASLLNVVKEPMALLQEALRLVKPGGLISFYLPNPSFRRDAVLDFIRAHRIPPSSAAILLTWSCNARALGHEQLLALFAEAGLEAAQITHHLGGMLSAVSAQRPAGSQILESVPC